VTPGDYGRSNGIDWKPLVFDACRYLASGLVRRTLRCHDLGRIGACRRGCNGRQQCLRVPHSAATKQPLGPANETWRCQKPLWVSDGWRDMQFSGLRGQRSTSADPVARNFQVAYYATGNKGEFDRPTQLVGNELADYAGPVARSAWR